MADPNYNIYPSVDVDGNFPPRIREALIAAPELSLYISDEVTDDLGKDPVLRAAANTAATSAVSAEAAKRNFVETTNSDAELTPGVAFSIVDDKNQRTWLEVANDGGPSKAAIGYMSRSGVSSTEAMDTATQPNLAFAVVDESGQRTWLEVANDGNPTPRVKTLLASLSGASTASPDYPTYGRFAHWGDSLTAAGSSGDWPTALQAKTGWIHFNGGIGGQGSQSISGRQGGNAPQIAPLTIPASGSVAISFIRAQYGPLNTGSSKTVNITDDSGTSVHGNLNRDADGNYTFVRDGSGNPVTFIGRVLVMFDDALQHRADYVTIWSGRNTFRSWDQRYILANIRDMIGYLTPRSKRVMVLEIPPQASEPNGTPDRAKLDSTNLALKQTFGDYYVPVASYLRTDAAFTAAGVEKTAQDSTDIANGVTPTSLSSDGLHFNKAGGNAIAAFLFTEAQNRGWF